MLTLAHFKVNWVINFIGFKTQLNLNREKELRLNNPSKIRDQSKNETSKYHSNYDYNLIEIN